MTRLQQLLDSADKLRDLADDDVEKIPLAAMVDEINAIRALPIDQQDTTEPLPKRKPGRPRKVAVEGEDA